MTPTQTRFLNMDHAELAEVAEGLVVALRDILRIATAASIGVSGNAPRLDRARAALNRAEGR